MACIADDPRWDQLDERADYLARLVLALAIDIATVDELLLAYASRASDVERKREPLALEVVGRLNQLGNLDATAVIRREAAKGPYREQAAEWLADELEDDSSDGPPAESGPDLSGAPTDELLAGGIPAPWPVLRELRTRDSPDDVAAMLRAADDPDCPMRAAAILALAHQERAELLPTLQTFSSSVEPRRVKHAMHRAFSMLPFAVTRATAIAWARAGTGEQRRAATLAFARHASPAEIPVVRELFTAELAHGPRANQYVLCDLAEALARCPQQGPFPELREAYREMLYSFGRRFVIEAMAATDRGFPEDLAIDCLWDCNDRIRVLGAEHASLRDPEAAARIAELAGDPLEEKDVRAAASARLA